MDIEALKQLHDKRVEYEMVDEVLTDVELDKKPAVSHTSEKYQTMLKVAYLSQYS